MQAPSPKGQHDWSVSTMQHVICSVPDCPKWVKCKGLCPIHYERQRKGKPLDGEVRRYTQQDLNLLASGRRVCSGPCGLTKPLSEFGKTKAMCRECSTMARTAWKRAHPEANRASVARYRERYPDLVAVQKKTWHDRDPAARRAHRLLTTYGLTLAQFQVLLESQNHGCAICQRQDPGGRHGVWHVDHDHDRRVVRGLLCDGCNRALGFFKDDVTAIRAAIEYLDRWGLAE